MMKMSELNLSVILMFGVFFANAEVPKDPGLIQSIEPNIDAIKGLVCYQCKSSTSELQPLCDKSIFRLATKEEKYNMSLQCPHYQGAYCFTKITKKGRYRDTMRGCSGPRDKNDNLMKVGCMTTKNERICLCDRKFCNGATDRLGARMIASIVAVIFFR